MKDNINIQTNTPNNLIEITNNDMESYIRRAEKLVELSKRNVDKTENYVGKSETVLDECQKLCDSLEEEIASLGDIHPTKMDNPHNVTAEQVGAYSKEEIDEKSFLTSVPPEYITEDELKDREYLTSNDIVNLATKSELELGLELKQGILTAGKNISLEDNIVSTSFDVADTDLSNLTENGKKVIDGQWVYSEYIVFEDVSLTSTLKIYDVSNYLPDDTNSYEVQILYEGHNSSNSTAMSLYSDENKTQEIFRVRTLSSASNSGGSGSIVFFEGNRKIYASSAGSINLAGCKLTFFAYRRLGTN